MPIDAALVRRLIAAQFPEWADLPVEPVEPGGWDNRTFRLGDRMSVRLPSAAAYVAQVEKEHRWLPRLAPHLPLPIPVPLAKGAPGEGYPWPWSVYRWLGGRPAAGELIADLTEFARSLAGFLVALYRIDAVGGPPAGQHNFHRGGRLSVYDAETRAALSALGGRIDKAAAEAVWATGPAGALDAAPGGGEGRGGPGARGGGGLEDVGGGVGGGSGAAPTGGPRGGGGLGPWPGLVRGRRSGSMATSPRAICSSKMASSVRSSISAVRLSAILPVTW
ncbi:phosphotransferase [Mesorhizobium sp. M0046]|uniref:phosphotransferase n=1 Tax=Mesorhizobium sp. M0046 TaxID=2956858 RepID=UPI00333622C4